VICTGNCVIDANCETGSYCPAGFCVPQSAQASACTGSRECLSGSCVDGFCCDRGCFGRCEACDVQGKPGTCAPVAGVPHGDRKACISDGTVCHGTCDGKNANSCTYPDTTVTCRNATCSNDVATVAATCDGAGGCPSLVTESCVPYHCAVKICAGNCVTDADCDSQNYCPAGICRPKSLLGIACGGARECISGHCADGVCCDLECGGQCEACNQFGESGMCKPVAGAPRGARASCSGTGPCAATCDGVNASTCTAPDAHTLCRPASCSFGVATAAAYCDGAGNCPEMFTLACEPYACSGSACADTCTTNGDCIVAYTCIDKACRKEVELGASCRSDATCASRHCVDGVCCESACSSQCLACDVAGFEGLCVAVEGAAHGSRGQCEAGSQCHDGSCASVSGGCGCSSSAGTMPALFLLVLVAIGRSVRRRPKLEESLLASRDRLRGRPGFI
jgi:hypothetical protein